MHTTENWQNPVILFNFIAKTLFFPFQFVGDDWVPLVLSLVLVDICRNYNWLQYLRSRLYETFSVFLQHEHTIQENMINSCSAFMQNS